MIFSRRLFFARPNTKSTRFSSHQVSKLSRQKPPSPRKMIRTFGHRPRICATIQATCFTLPAAASMFEGRNFASSKCSPQKMYSGR